MKTVWERRASTILFHLARSLQNTGTFLIPANVCPVVPALLMKAQRPFELIDIDPDTLCLDQAALLQKLQDHPQRYCGVIFVHTYGVRDSFESVFQAIRQVAPQLLLIDDRCLCIPSFQDEMATAADVVLYSTGYSKYVDLGFGGYAFMKPEVSYRPVNLPYRPSDHEALVQAMKEAQETGNSFRYQDSGWLDSGAPQGTFEAYRSEVIARSERMHLHKESLNCIYTEMIPPEVLLPDGHHDWRFNILVPQKEELLKTIFAHGLFASSHYPSLLGIFGVGEGARAHHLHHRVVNLFNNDRFTVEQAEQTARIVNSHLDIQAVRS